MANSTGKLTRCWSRACTLPLVTINGDPSGSQIV
jgi:hypothetical protein